jgi:hypothetical protein
MSNTAEINSKKYLLVANELYPSIIDEFAEIEDEKTLDAIQVERLTEKIKKAFNILKQIDTSAISTRVDEEQVQIIEHNINFMYEELLYIQKRLMADEYVDNLRVPVRKYIKSVAGDPSNYREWAKNENELTQKFIAMLTSPDNIETYKNQIRRMMIGTMSLKEFKKIFDATKHKMIPRWEEQKKKERQKQRFESFKEYKDDYEA